MRCARSSPNACATDCAERARVWPTPAPIGQRSTRHKGLCTQALRQRPRATARGELRPHPLATTIRVMRTGRLPGQEEALAEMLRAKRRLARRRFLRIAGGGMAIGLAGGSAVTALVMASSADRVTPPTTDTPLEHSPNKEQQWAAELASHGTERQLLDQGSLFLTVAEHNPSDRQLWQGVLRLGFALLEDDGRHSALRRRLIHVLGKPEAPPILAPLRNRLRSP